MKATTKIQPLYAWTVIGCAILGGAVAFFVANNEALHNLDYMRSEAGTISPAPLSAGVLTYDVVVDGAGASGVAAAIQAARMGMKVALIENTDLVGGQLLTVTSMDEGSVAVERAWSGIYSEFATRVTSHYAALGKSVATCGLAAPAAKLCFEPNVGQNILRQMIAQANPQKPIDLYLTTKITSVIKSGSLVTGATTDTGKTFVSKILIDATEYGDLLPLAGAAFRIGNGTGSAASPGVCIQDITYTEIVKKYATGTMPINLTIASSPPNYATRPRFENIVTATGSMGSSPPVNWTFYPKYRGTPDSSRPGTYTSDQYWLITKTFDNWANDYGGATATTTLSTQYLKNPTFRQDAECKAKLRTMQFLYYAQKNGRAGWSVDNQSGFNTAYNTAHSCTIIPTALKTIESFMPLRPYVRESRRMIGVGTLTAPQIKAARDNPAASPIWPDALALGYYNLDLHGCKTNNTLELSLENSGDIDLRYGAFPIPFSSFIPQTLNGFLAAEKNISQSRLANGGTRLQPSAMRIGQAAGVIAALSIQKGIQPRAVKPASVQKVLLDRGFILSPYTFSDVPTSSIYWKSVQLVSMKKILVGSGDGTFGVNNAIPRKQIAVALVKGFNIPTSTPATPTFADVPKTSIYYPYIEGIYKAGITAGCGGNPPNFCPDSLTTRAQFAVLLVKTMGLALSTTTTPYFTDVPQGSFGFAYIQTLVQKGLAVGCGTNLFCPSNNITRGQTAAMVANGIAY
ncbi:MAG: FAD-dependent oxidoreductase [bacterium]|nr:FAD-dependent oxidoreductase [bacterium]